MLQAKLNRIQRSLLFIAWVAVALTTLYPPVLIDGVVSVGRKGKFIPIYELFYTAYSSPAQFLYVDHGVDWATLALLWTWIALGLIAGLWFFCTRSHPK